MRHIGGFFELEPTAGCQGVLHPSALALHTGRACLMMMLSILTPRCVYVPYYTCDATLAPFHVQKIKTIFYEIDEHFLPVNLPVLHVDDYLLYTNYFGLCEKQVEYLERLYGSHLLVDDTHAFFRGHRKGLWTFTSARKYFGVPDGAYLYAPVSLPDAPDAFDGISLKHLQLRAKGRQAEAFLAHQNYERSLDTRVFGISSYSNERLSKIDYASIAKNRCSNYEYLDRVLASSNLLNLEMHESVPFCYPYLPSDPIPHHQLYARQIYPPKLWADVLNRCTSAWERTLVESLLPLPIDHRYRDDSMQMILEGLGATYD